MPADTVHETLTRALSSYDDLALLGEKIEDEWTYVTDLATAWRDRLDELRVARGNESVTPEVAVAVDRATDEIGRIADPHRAIDWLSTFPQVVLVAFGERP